MMKQNIPILDAAEQRVLGSLIEKSRTTPDYYPMTVNGLTSACNQKTSRNPIVNYSDADVSIILDSLKKKGLTSTATGGSSRAVKYKHNLAVVFPVVPAELAVIACSYCAAPKHRAKSKQIQDDFMILTTWKKSIVC